MATLPHHAAGSPWTSISPSTSFSPRGRVTSATAVPPSPKRPRQTPSPADQSPSPHVASSSTSSHPQPSLSNMQRPRSRLTRPTLVDKRAVTFDRHVMTSPYRGTAPMTRESSDSNEDRGLVRRRELSVPLVSSPRSASWCLRWHWQHLDGVEWVLMYSAFADLVPFLPVAYFPAHTSPLSSPSPQAHDRDIPIQSARLCSYASTS